MVNGLVYSCQSSDVSVMYSPSGSYWSWYIAELFCHGQIQAVVVLEHNTADCPLHYIMSQRITIMSVYVKQAEYCTCVCCLWNVFFVYNAFVNQCCRCHHFVVSPRITLMLTWHLSRHLGHLVRWIIYCSRGWPVKTDCWTLHVGGDVFLSARTNLDVGQIRVVRLFVT